MSKKNYYEDIKFVKRAKFRGFKALGIFLILGVFVCGTYFLSVIFSNTVSVTGSVFSLKKNKSINKSYYAISFGIYDNIEDARTAMNNLLSIGAGGYILKYENKYNVLGAIYLNESDANSVIDSNKKYNYNGMTYELSVFKINIDLNKKFYSKFGNDSNIIYDATKVLVNTIEDLYNNSILLEKEEISNIILANKVNSLDSNLVVELKKIEALTVNSSNFNISNFYEKILKMEKILNNLTNTLLVSHKPKASIKYSLINFIMLFSEIK